MLSPSHPECFGRFEVLRTLGKGGSGIVYLCKDGTSGGRVALKELQVTSVDAIFRFKREFRLLSRLAHPNLIRLRELHASDGKWFFTMDYVEGAEFLDWVRGPDGVHIERLRRSMDELTAALGALHACGYAHCDVKSQNVRVDQHGRVVVLDLGLAAPLDGSYRVAQDRRPKAGTPRYMAPEQAAGHEVSSASDLYSVGVLLFAALTGTFPFEGRRKDVLRNKQLYDARWPQHAVSPADLRDTCLGLLRIDPDRRPTLDELRNALGFGRSHPSDVFVGRVEELQALSNHEREHRGRFSAVLIVGESGIGKTSLAEAFLALPDAAILQSRCYDCEAVPFNALDGMVDDLRRSFEDDEWTAALHELDGPTRASLVRLFPILSPSKTPEHHAEELDRNRALDCAIDGLARLFANLAERRRVCVFIDDLHWADSDSVQALASLFASPDAPPVLVLATYRPSGADLVSTMTRDWGCVQTVRLTGLSRSESGALVETYGLSQEAGNRYVADCAGHPLFLRTLCLAHSALGVADSSRGLDSLLDEILGDVGIDEQLLLGLLSLCPRPLQRRTLREASGLGLPAFTMAISSLTEKRLARSRGPQETDTLESYHDRTARLVRGRMKPSVRLESHRQLCLAMDRDDLPPEDMLDHLEAIGEHSKARRKALEVARTSRAAYAFARAALLFDRVVRLSAVDDSDRPHVLVELGEAHAQAGEARRAAAAFLRAAEGAARDEGFNLRRRAADQLIYSGAVQQGLAVLEPEMRHYRIGLQASRLRVAAELIARRATLLWRGLSWKPGPASTDVLQRIDVLWTLCRLYSFVDSALAANMHSEGLLLALEAGEPKRIARGLALELGFLAMSGETDATRYDAIQERAYAAAVLAKGADAAIAVEGGIGIMQFLTGQWQSAHRTMDAVSDPIKRVNVISWERRTAEFVALSCLELCGQVKEVRRRLPRLLREAAASEDMFFSTSLRLRLSSMVKLYDDDAEGALRCIDEATRDWPFGKGVQKYYALLSRMRVLLYQGHAEGALWLFRREGGSLDEAYFRAPASRTETDYVVGTALLSIRSSKEAKRRELRTLLRRLERVVSPVAKGMAMLVEAGFCAQVDGSARAVRGYEAAASELSLHGLTLHATAARWRAVELAGDRDEVDRGAEALRGKSVRNPGRLVQLLAPVLPE
jgi:eukaryotic-like serine/threonine-protein kinase